jgi:uncharacterized protein (DUF433 family)
MVVNEDAAAETITKTPGVLGGAACIGNRRIAVWMVVEARRLGYTDAELLQRYDPPLTPQELAAAFCYHEQHPEEIEADIQNNRED